MNVKFRAYINYGYTEKELNDPDMFEELQTTGLGFMDIPDLIDFENKRIKYDSDWYDKNRFKLMQYTGILDKKGQEIYEKDFIKNTQTEKVYEVVWNGSHAAFELKDMENQYKSLFFANQSFEKYEVIGNIYENPEMLKGWVKNNESN